MVLLLKLAQLLLLLDQVECKFFDLLEQDSVHLAQVVAVLFYFSSRRHFWQVVVLFHEPFHLGEGPQLIVVKEYVIGPARAGRAHLHLVGPDLALHGQFERAGAARTDANTARAQDGKNLGGTGRAVGPVEAEGPRSAGDVEAEHIGAGAHAVELVVVVALGRKDDLACYVAVVK